MPQGDCPSLKFHFRSDNRVLLSPTIGVVVAVVVEKGVDVDRCSVADLPAGGAKAVEVEASATTARIASSTRLEKFWFAMVTSQFRVYGTDDIDS